MEVYAGMWVRRPLLNRLVVSLRVGEMLLLLSYLLRCHYCQFVALGRRGSMVFVCLVRHLRCLHPFLIGRSFVLSLAVEVVAMIQGGAFFSENFREWGWNRCQKSYIFFLCLAERVWVRMVWR